VQRGTWDEPRVFSVIQAAGAVSDDEMAAVFNLGLGMVALVAPDAVEAAVDTIRAAGHDAWVVGDVVDGNGRVHVARS
jgi:phosphoribosylformylglycinamidine cyclo-ligase